MRLSRLIASCAFLACATPLVSHSARAERPWQNAPTQAHFIADHPLSSPVMPFLTALPSGTLYSLDDQGVPQRIDLVDGQLYPLTGLPPLTALTANSQGIWGVTRGPKFELLNIAPTSGTILNRIPVGAAAHSTSHFPIIQVTDTTAYLGDEQDPALVVIDLKEAHVRRILENSPSLSSHTPLLRNGHIVKAANGEPYSGGNIRFMVLDHSEQWLFYQTPTGPLYRLATALLTDPSISPAEQIEGMAKWRSTPSLGGLAINDKDTLYMIDIDHGDLLAFGADRIPLRLLHDEKLTQAQDIALLPRSSKAALRLAVLLKDTPDAASKNATHLVEIALP